ncbi:helix-turn-helix transcriptional regulator [Actinopolymorpha sp. B17G11]|uniref:helix-turn-helix transcriptional regulator n=1 Tax=Actinopolymorpha sp. B17G11 TaxID=3160861 RepID=UPI0032E4F9F6
MLNDRFGIPFCVELLAWLAGLGGDAERAALLLGMGNKMWEPIGVPLFGSAALRDWSVGCRVRSAEVLGADAFEAAFQRGSGFTFDAAVAYALGEQPKAAPDTSTAPRVSASALTKREREVALLVARGMGNREIASALVISKRTAETHVENILTKLGFTSRAQIAAWTARQREK